MTYQEPDISIKVDVANPGQFFACCGLLELADRLWAGAEGWFADMAFFIQTEGTLADLLHEVIGADLEALDPNDQMASAMLFHAPFELTLDWWTDEQSGGRQLKVWAGSMRGVRIAQAMKEAIRNIGDENRPFDHAEVVYDPRNPAKKVEPFYYDGRRGCNARPIDIGFSPDKLNMISAAYPVVEFFCLVGLQRFRPRPGDHRRVFDYRTWSTPLTPCLAAAAVSGLMPLTGGANFRFENAFRTDQRKHKAFLPATPHGACNEREHRSIR